MGSVLAYTAVAVFGTAWTCFWGTITKQTFCTETGSTRWWLSSYAGGITIVVTMIVGFLLNHVGGAA